MITHWTAQVALKAFSSDNPHFQICPANPPPLLAKGMAISAKRAYNITALQRGLRLLDLFARAGRGLSATEVAKLSSLPASTVHRFLVNLEAAGFLQCGFGTYHLGIACFSLGHAALGQLDVRRVSLPYLRELNEQTRETVHLTVRHGLTAVYVEKLDSPEPLRIYSRIGAAVPLHCTGVGKVILAYLSPAEQQAVLQQVEIKRLTANTVGSLQELHMHLQRVRKNGYAWDLEEYEPHIRCIAAPIWDHSGAVNAALSITGPAVRMSTVRLRQLVPVIQDAGLRISRELGYQIFRAEQAPAPASTRRSSRQGPAGGREAPPR